MLLLLFLLLYSHTAPHLERKQRQRQRQIHSPWKHNFTSVSFPSQGNPPQQGTGWSTIRTIFKLSFLKYIFNPKQWDHTKLTCRQLRGLVLVQLDEQIPQEPQGDQPPATGGQDANRFYMFWLKLTWDAGALQNIHILCWLVTNWKVCHTSETVSRLPQKIEVLFETGQYKQDILVNAIMICIINMYAFVTLCRWPHCKSIGCAAPEWCKSERKRQRLESLLGLVGQLSKKLTRPGILVILSYCLRIFDLGGRERISTWFDASHLVGKCVCLYLFWILVMRTWMVDASNCGPGSCRASKFLGWRRKIARMGGIRMM